MKRLYQFFIYFTLGLAALLTLGVAILESNPGKNFALNLLASGLRNSGLSIEAGSVTGKFPQHFQVQNAVIKHLAGRTVEIDQMRIQLSLLYLLKRELYIESLEADGIRVGKEEESFSIGSEIPISISVASFDLKNIAIPELFHAKGKLKIRRGAKTALLHCALTRPEYPESICRIDAGKNRNGLIELQLQLDTPTLAALQPWLPERSEGALHLSLQVKGDYEAYQGKFSGSFDAKTIHLPSPLDEVAEKEWAFRGKLKKEKGKNLQFKQLLASSRHLRFKGSVDLDSEYSLARARLQTQTDLHSFPHSPLAGRLFASAEVERQNETLKLKGNWHIPELAAAGQKLEEAKGTFEGSLLDQSLFGKAQCTARFLKETWKLESPLSYRPKDALYLEKILIESPLLKAEGDLSYRADGLLVGKMQAERFNLQLVQRFAPELPLYGFGSASCSFEAVAENGAALQGARAEVVASEVYFGPAYCQKIDADLVWREDIKGSLTAEIGGAKYEKLFLETATLSTGSTGESWPFHLTATGMLRDPLSLDLEGFWSYREKELLLALETGSGMLLNYPILLENPAIIRWKNDAFSCKDFQMAVGIAGISFSYQGNPEESDGKLVFDQLPLDFLSLNPLDVAVTGQISLNADLHKRRGKLQGVFSSSIEQLEVKVPGEKDLLMAHGTFSGDYRNELLALKGGLEVRDTPLLTIDAKIPIRLQTWPLRADLLLDRQAAGRFAMQGRIEDFLDFFDFGPHLLDGDCTCDLTLRNTLGNPRLEGSIELENGYYQNYFTGTELIDLRAEILAENDHLYLRHLTGRDGKEKGNFQASGSLKLSVKERFPFRIDSSFERINAIQIDFVTAEAEGRIAIDGNLDSAIAKGTVRIVECDMTIPDSLPRQLPELQVLYKNAPKPIAHVAPHIASAYPLNLDLSIDAPDGIFIGGKGLHSEWKGNFHLGGTYTSLAPKGKLELMSGEFVFSGRNFKLTDGSVTLVGKEGEMPHLDIAGTLLEKGISITARLRGPINQPQLTFQSIPPLPLSGILSYLLFGEDVSNIDGLQALQLAATVASVAGEGADLLESTRKSLGIDRLRIISTPGSEEDSKDRLALQVGKYVAEGVIVSFSQSTEDSAPNISIEVDIGAGFYFEAESVQQEEQGKFTIKWSRNY